MLSKDCGRVYIDFWIHINLTDPHLGILINQDKTFFGQVVNQSSCRVRSRDLITKDPEIGDPKTGPEIGNPVIQRSANQGSC
jgi:hypothetical protein